MESVTQRSGDNLYSVSLKVQFGDYSLDLDVPEGVWNPTPHGILLGEILAKTSFEDEDVLELGTGCGLHAIVIAKQGAKTLALTEIESSILYNARHNLEKHEVNIETQYWVRDWVNVDEGQFDTVVTNPPFAKSGKRYRRYFIDTYILEAHKLLRRGGRMIFVQSSMADIPKSIRLMEASGMEVQILAEREGPFRNYYFEDHNFMKEIACLPNSYTVREGTHYERLMVFEARLRS